jgi:hypothetical protein
MLPPPTPTHTRPKKKKKKNTHQNEILSRSRGWVVIIVVLPRFRSKHSTPTQHKGLLLYPADFCCNTRRERTSKRLNPFPKSSPFWLRLLQQQNLFFFLFFCLFKYFSKKRFKLFLIFDFIFFGI